MGAAHGHPTAVLLAVEGLDRARAGLADAVRGD